MKKNILIAAVMLLAFSAVASAQATYTVATIPVTTVSSCGTTELTGDVILNEVATSSTTTTGTFTLTYGVPITSALADIVVTVNNGGAATGLVTVSPTSNLNGGQLVLQLTPGATNLANIDVRGVRVNVAGSTNLSSLDVTVTSTGNAIQGALTAKVINSIASSIASVTATPAITINALNPSAVLPTTATVTVTEGFFNAFVLNSVVGVTFSPVPVGLQLDTFPATITDAQGTVFTLSTATGVTAGVTPPTFTSATTTPQVFYKVTTVGANADANQELLLITFNVTTTAGAVLPLTPATLPTVTADMFPKAGGTVATPPLFSGTNCQKTSTAPFITITTATSTLLMPYATTVAGYDTGIAIANTTNGPTTATAVTKQSGTITFWLVPADGSAPFSITPTGTAGGLQAGLLPAGGEFVYLLSSLLADAQKPANFSGNIFVVCNFTNAHGQYFISNFEAFTNGALMLVVQTPRSAGAESLGN